MEKERRMKFPQFVSFLAMTILLTGCASSQSGEVYSRDQTRQAQTVELGTVEFIKEVEVEGSRSGLGAAAGGITGGVLGSMVGGGKGSALATLGGAAVGVFTGSKVEEKTSQYTGLEITVKLDNGKAVVVVQEADVPFAVGERVRVLSARDGTTRVEK